MAKIRVFREIGFGDFGEIIHVQLAIDRAANLSRGDAYVEFKAKIADAEKPQLYMDGVCFKPVSSSSGRSPPKRFQFPRLRFNTISVHCLTFYLSAGGLPSKDPWQSCSKTFSSKVPSKKKVSNPQTADVADNQFVGNSMLVRVQDRYHPAGEDV
ncbi:unnamed protein product [Arabidopsis thaliana]|uniref:(thale cress) hypothetical protein n=1 Tax=Arabidopsis thaliana TaxID=3702 RepID=A0A7G2E5Y4_ARATH|nr:unnamed protein product [Arabidopsis thaliana]